MVGTINFELDKVNDIVIATPNWKVDTKEDCEIWFNQWNDYLSKFGKKVDCIRLYIS
jgi:hypothetical protein